MEAVKAAGAQEDVGLPLQGLAKGMVALRDDIVKNTACGEDVHCVGLKEMQSGRPQTAITLLTALILLQPLPKGI